MTATLPRLVQSDSDRQARIRQYNKNRDYYDGRHRISQDRRRYNRPRNNIDILVDTIVAHMGAPSISWGDTPAADALDHHLERVLAFNDAEVLDETTETGCAIDGDACWKVTYDDEAGQVRIASIDPAQLWTRTAPDDPTSLLQVAQQYYLGAEHLPLVFGSDAVGAGEGRVLVTESWTRSTWEVWTDQTLRLSQPNPYAGAIPYVVFPLIRLPGQTWGHGYPERLIDGQDRINAAGADLDHLMEIASSVVVLENAEAGGDLVLAPGAFWELPAESRAYILDFLAGNAAESRVRYLTDLRSDIRQAARVPDLALGLQDVSDASGSSLQIQLGPMLRLVARARLSRGAAHRRRARLIAALGSLYQGLPPAGDLLPVVTWTEPLPTDRSIDLSNALMELQLGRSREDVLRSIGVAEPIRELARRRQEDLTTGRPEQPQPGPAEPNALADVAV